MKQFHQQAVQTRYNKNLGLNKLLCMLGDNESIVSEELFEFSDETPTLSYEYEQADIDLVAAFCSCGFGSNLADQGSQLAFDGIARQFYELSTSAFSAFVHAWASELPVQAQMLSYGRRVIAATKQRADSEALDRGNEDTRLVLTAAYKVQHEIHRITGFLRFTPDSNGVFVARCAPDHFVLPALGDHFTVRFGETAWAIIDEKRGLCLSRQRSNPRPVIKPFTANAAGNKNTDGWEELWRHYHKTINNEDRKNPNLQRQFIPQRYRKYLTEM